MKKLGERKLGLEGSEEGRWILIDYGDFVVHIFSAEGRDYYALEEIWGDAPQLEWTVGGTASASCQPGPSPARSTPRRTRMPNLPPDLALSAQLIARAGPEAC